LANSFWDHVIQNSIRQIYFPNIEKSKSFVETFTRYTDKKENHIFLIYREIQSGAVAKSYKRKGFLIYEEMRKYFPIYEEAVSHI
jgi:hypothetical protein